MSDQVNGGLKLRMFELFFGCMAGWAVLQGLVVLALQGWRLGGVAAGLVAGVPALPLGVMVWLGVRGRRVGADLFPRIYLVGICLFASVLLCVDLLMVFMVTAFFMNKPEAARLLAGMSFLMVLPAGLVLLLPSMTLAGGERAEALSPVRVKLATPALKRICREFAVYLGYLLLKFASDFFLEGDRAVGGVMTYVLALLPVLPVFGLIWVYGAYVWEEEDEFQRRLFDRSILWALLGTLVVACGLGRLVEHVAFFQRHADFFRLYSILPLFLFLQIEAGFMVMAVQSFRVMRQEKLGR